MTSHEAALRQNMVSLHSEGSSGPSLRSQEHLSVKHALPKTRVTHTILHENVSQDRHLKMVMTTLNNRQQKYEGLAYQTRKNFLNRQRRKEEKWKREDTVRLQGLNFPILRNCNPDNRPESMLVTYRKPCYPMTASDDIEEAKPPDLNAFLLPIMEITPEKTQIVTHREKTFITQLPPVMKVDELKLERFNTYCGKTFLKRSLPSESTRFDRLTRSLSNIPAHFENFSMENLRRLHDDVLENYEKVDPGESDNSTRVEADVASDAETHEGERQESVNSPEQTIYRRLKVDRECMFPMLNKLTRTASEGTLINGNKGTGHGRSHGASRRRSELVVKDFKTKSIKDLTKKYGFFATASTRFSRSSKDVQ